MRRLPNGDVGGGATLIAMGVLMLAASGSWALSSWRMPILVGWSLVMIGAGVVVAGVVRSREKPTPRTPRRNVLDVAAFFVLSTLYVLLMTRAGFIVTSLVLFVVAVWALGGVAHNPRGVLLAAVFSGLVTGSFILAFIRVFRVPLPSGSWWG